MPQVLVRRAEALPDGRLAGQVRMVGEDGQGRLGAQHALGVAAEDPFGDADRAEGVGLAPPVADRAEQLQRALEVLQRLALPVLDRVRLTQAAQEARLAGPVAVV